MLGTGAGIIFKGSGFYSTDYRKPSYTEGAKKEAGTTTTPDAKAPTTGKPAAPKSPPSKD